MPARSVGTADPQVPLSGIPMGQLRYWYEIRISGCSLANAVYASFDHAHFRASSPLGKRYVFAIESPISFLTSSNGTSLLLRVSKATPKLWMPVPMTPTLVSSGDQ